LGSASQLDPDASCLDLQRGDTLLLCSDGLHGYMSDEEIYSILSGNPVEKAGSKLIALALDRGGVDNITVVILNI